MDIVLKSKKKVRVKKMTKKPIHFSDFDGKKHKIEKKIERPMLYPFSKKLKDNKIKYLEHGRFLGSLQVDM